MMNALLLPAAAVMNRLSYRAKFALLGAIIFVAFASLSVALWHELAATIDRSRTELIASGLARPLLKTVELTQQHRGMSLSLLSGLTAIAERRAEKEKEVEAAFGTLDAALPDAQRSQAAWRELREQWAKIRREGLGWAPPENVAAHSRLVTGLLSYQILLADEYGLTFDPEKDTHYLMSTAIVRMPDLLERMGLLRAKGTAALARGSMDEGARVDLVVLVNEIRAALHDLEVNVAKISERRPDLKPRLEASLDSLRTRLDEVLRVVQAILGGDFFVTLSNSFFDLATGAITVGYEQAHEIMLPTLDEVLTERIADAQRVLYFNLGVLAVVLLLIAYLSMGTYRSIMGSVERLSEGSRRLAAGDLTVRIDLETRDELRLIGESFNAMTESMRRLIAAIQANASDLAEAAQGMLGSAQQIDTASQRQSESASSMAAAVEEMTVGIDHIAGNAGHANELARESGRLSGEGGLIVETVIREIGDIAASVAVSAKTIEELGQSSEQISTIVGVIKEIADQTNLLALNAAIEAARAGEQGRGFAVVADEVRKLAERTTHSTVEISQMVHSIQEGARGAVTSMERGVSRVKLGVDRAQEAGQAMSLIRQGAERVVTTVAEISEALREQSAASTEIARNVETIARMAEENSASAAVSVHAANRLGTLAESLREDVGRFRAGT